MTLKTLFLPIALFVLTMSLFADSLPKRPHWVNDGAEILTPAQEQELTGYLQSVQQKSSSQIVVLTVKSLDGRSIEEYSLEAAEAFKIGQKGKDNGVLLLVAPNDRELRIEVGYGLEGDLTDAKCSYIIRNTIVPYFKAGDFGQGVLAGIQSVGSIVLKESDISPEELAEFQARSNGSGSSEGSGAIVVIVLVIIALLIFPPTRPFVSDILLLLVLTGGRGGRSGGSSGGGGFSGGGGSFGGGGSSGSW